MLINYHINKITGSKSKDIDTFELDLMECCLIYIPILWSECVIFLVSLPKDSLIPSIELGKKEPSHRLIIAIRNCCWFNVRSHSRSAHCQSLRWWTLNIFFSQFFFSFSFFYSYFWRLKVRVNITLLSTVTLHD